MRKVGNEKMTGEMMTALFFFFFWQVEKGVQFPPLPLFPFYSMPYVLHTLGNQASQHACGITTYLPVDATLQKVLPVRLLCSMLSNCNLPQCRQ